MAWMLSRLFLRKKAMRTLRDLGGWSAGLKRASRSITYLFNLHTLALLALSFLAVYICDSFGWSYNMDFSMISTGTVFPLTFTLAQAYTRRERATDLIANLKASAVALYYMHRDWDQTWGPQGLGNDNLPGARAAKALLVELLITIRRFLVASSPFESVAEARLTASTHEYMSLFQHDIQLSNSDRAMRAKVVRYVQEDPSEVHLKHCYVLLSRLSVLNEKLTFAAGYTRGGEGGLSRTAQYLRYIITNLEELRSLKTYRTPTMMRHACAVLVHIFAIVMAPYFVHFCSATEHEEGNCAPAYASSGAYVLITMLLYHVQSDMENCFDETGLDDVFISMAEEVDQLGGPATIHSVHSSCSDMSRLVRSGSPPRASMDFTGVALGSGGSYGLQPRGSSPEIPHLRAIPSGEALSDMPAKSNQLSYRRASSGALSGPPNVREGQQRQPNVHSSSGGNLTGGVETAATGAMATAAGPTQAVAARRSAFETSAAAAAASGTVGT